VVSVQCDCSVSGANVVHCKEGKFNFSGIKLNFCKHLHIPCECRFSRKDVIFKFTNMLVYSKKSVSCNMEDCF
jgi:hypothetical protein